MTTNNRLSPVYVLDAHALFWYWATPARLGPTARAVFAALSRREATALVPILVVAEVHFLTRKLGAPVSVETILRVLDRAPSLRLEALTRRQLVAFGQINDIPEMHDRFIAAVGLVHDAPIVTRDPVIQASALVNTVW